MLVGLLGFGLTSLPDPTPYSFPELTRFPPMPVSVANPVTVEGANLGRHLFYDPILSRDSSFSCASCHQQAFAFANGPVQFSTGIDGDEMKRNTMPLFNLAWYNRYFWDGRAATLENQVFHPVRDNTEMDLPWHIAEKRINQSQSYRAMFRAAFGTSKIDSSQIAKAIGQFLRTLISNNSFYDRVLRGEAHFDSATYAGFVLVNDQSMANCLHCHTTDADALGTKGTFSNNGLDGFVKETEYSDIGLAETTQQATDVGLFKIPSFRNVALTAPYMHDGRFKTLDEVLDFYSEGVKPGLNVDSKMARAHQGGVRLTTEEKRCIVLFLHSLTDTSFTSNPAFANPWVTSSTD